MVISEQFKLLHLKKKRKSKKGQNEEKNEKKSVFCNLKKCIFFAALFCFPCSFGFAFQR
jgi:hypothetical protein